MKRFFVAALVLLTSSATASQASDPVGVYALIDKVVMEPNEQEPQRIRVWGVFSVASSPRGEYYHPPQRGYLYFKLPAGQEQAARREWNDLKKIAGTAEVVALGSRYQWRTTVHRPSAPQPTGTADKGQVEKLIADLNSNQFAVREKASKELAKLGNSATPLIRIALAGSPTPEVRRRLEALVETETPDVYPVDSGVTKMRRNMDYDPVRNLYLAPAPLTPADGGVVDAGEVVLKVKALSDPQARPVRYVFEIDIDRGGKRTSQPIAPHDKEVSWSTGVRVQPGHTYTWRVWVVDNQWKGPAVQATFIGKPTP